MDINNNEMQTGMVVDPDFESLVDNMPEPTEDDFAYNTPRYDAYCADDELTEANPTELVGKTEAPATDAERLMKELIMDGPELSACHEASFDTFVDSILTNGVTFLNAFSKVGKSRLMMQMLLAVSSGKPFLGMPTQKCDTLYLPLEDTKSDTVSRLKAFCKDTPAPKGFHAIIGDAPLLKTFGDEIKLGDDSSLIRLLESVLKHNPDIRVIGIDVFGVIRSSRKSGEDFTQHERRDIGYLLDFANKHNVAVVVAHHVSKTGLSDKSRANATGSGAGSYVISSAVHTEWCIALDKDDNTKANFSYNGRRIRGGSMILKSNYPRWDRIGTGSYNDEKFREDPLVPTIQYLVNKYSGWRGTSKQFIEAHNQARTETDLPVFSITPTKRVFDKLSNALYQIGITYTYQSNGSGGGIHCFSKNPVTVTAQQQQQISF